MPDTINGKTPEEIKKGLECCSMPLEVKVCSIACPYGQGKGCARQLTADALAYIQQIESLLAQAARERDAAVADLEEARNCADCKHCYDSVFNEPCSSCIEDEETKKNWQWRGVVPANRKENK